MEVKALEMPIYQSNGQIMPHRCGLRLLQNKSENAIRLDFDFETSFEWFHSFPSFKFRSNMYY